MLPSSFSSFLQWPFFNGDHGRPTGRASKAQRRFTLPRTVVTLDDIHPPLRELCGLHQSIQSWEFVGQPYTYRPMVLNLNPHAIARQCVDCIVIVNVLDLDPVNHDPQQLTDSTILNPVVRLDTDDLHAQVAQQR
jgi:hypothetical protein